MANYANLLATIAANIYQNNNNEVSADMVKAAMNAAVASLGAGFQFMGVATPATTPGNTDIKQFYIASEPGTYTNFLDSGSNPLEVNDGEVAVLKYDTAWSKEVTGAATTAQLSALGDEVQNLGAPPIGSVDIQQVPGGVIQYIPKHWINEYNKAVLEFSFKTPASAPASTQFLLSIKGLSANDFFYYLSGGGLNANIGGVSISLAPSSAFLPDTDHILRWEKDGTTQKFYIDGVFVNTANATPNDCQSVYIGCYPNSTGVEALIKFYSLTIYDNSGDVVEKQDAGDSFAQMTGELESTANFADYYDKDVIFSGAYYLNETISISGRGLYGAGCKILCGEDAKIIVGENASIQGFVFIGDWNPTRTTTAGHYAYDPIMTDADIADIDNYISDFLIALRGTNASVLNCTIRNLDRTAILCDSLDAYTGSKQVNINGNELYYNKCGIAYLTEFATIGANRINACLVGIYAKGGNLSFVNNNILMADCAIIVGDTGNGGHSEFTGNEIAHAGKYGIYCPELGRGLGNLYSGGQIIDAPIKFINTSMFMIIGCRLNTYYELTWDQGTYPQGIEGNSVHSCNIDNTYAVRDSKPVFYYPDGGLSLKLNMHPYYVPDADVNN